MRSQNEFDEEDYFHDTRMSFGDHLEVLRTHLWRAIYGLGFCLIIGFVLDAIGDFINVPSIGIGRPLMGIIQEPVKIALREYYDKRREKFDEQSKIANSDAAKAKEFRDMPVRLAREERAKLLGVAPDQLPEGDVELSPVAINDTNQIMEKIIRPRELTTLSAQEAFVIYFKVSLIAGFVIASPWVFWQIWSFIAAGLYPNEKHYVHVYLPVSLILFIAGVVLCQFVVMPKAVGALLYFNDFLGMTPDLRLSEWLSLAIMLPVVFGISFETPLAMLFLERIGLMTADSFRGYRKMAIFVMAVFAAVITPTPDAITMMYLWIPMCLLYEFGIWLCAFSPNKKRELEDLDVPTSDDLVEV